MATKRWQGDAVAIAQVTTLTPPAAPGEIGITINGKTLTHPSWDAPAIANKWNLVSDVQDPVASSPEFREISASEDGGSLVLTAVTAGKPFIVTTTVDGLSVSSETQLLSRVNGVTGGTFTATFDGQTTGAIAYNASAATVQTALVALSNIAPGDVTVTETLDGWQIKFGGAYAGTDVQEITINSGSLTGGVSALNEIQQLSLGYAASPVTFKLKRTDTGDMTADLTTPVTDSDVETELTALGYTTTCSGGPLIDGAISASPALTDDGIFGQLAGAPYIDDTSVGMAIKNNGTESAVGLLRFSLDIPQGSDVTSAIVTVTKYGSTGSRQVQIKAEDADDAAMPATYSDASSAALTTAAVTATLNGSSSTTNIDITSVIQEIVDRAGWVSGNHVVIHFNPTGASAIQYRMCTIENGSGEASMTATYTGSGTSAPIVIEWTGGDAASDKPQLVVVGTGTLPTIVTLQDGVGAVSPLVVPSTTIPGGSTIPVVETQESRGPNHWDDPLNWSGGTVPVNADDVSIDHSEVDILYGIDQSGLTLASLTIGASFTGKLGLAETNSEGSDSYIEYRQQYLELTVPVVRIGDGVGNGSNLIRLNVLGNNSIDVRQTGSPDTNGLTALQVISSGNITANIVKGSVGFGLYEGEVAAVTSLKVGYKDTPTGDSVVVLGPGATCTTLDMAGGVVTASHAPGTITMTDGELTIDDGSITSLKQRAGIVRYNGNDTITLAEISGVLDFQQDMRAKTVTTIKLYEGFEYHDPHGVVTWTNPCQFVQCSPADGEFNIAKNITLALALL